MGAHRGHRLLTDAPPLVVCDPVEAALGGGRAVVALESTVIAHGLPYPRNAEVARDLERLVSEAGAVPATIGIVDGVVRIGLDPEGIDRFAADPDVLKASVRDLGAVVAGGGSAATTVAATATLAARAGLRLEHRVEDETAAARAIAAHRALVPTSGCLVCNPPPAEREIDASEVGSWVERAGAEAEEAGVRGKALTPWLLARLAELSDGRTVEANVALLESNARAAAGIARALAASA